MARKFKFRIWHKKEQNNFYGGISFTSERTIIGNIFEGIKCEKN